MVRELTRERTEDFQTACAYERVFGSEILTLLRVYGLEDDQVRFYLEEQEGRPAAAIALLVRMISRNERAVAEATSWLKRIVVTWIVLNTLGFIVAYLQPLIQGGQYTPTS